MKKSRVVLYGVLAMFSALGNYSFGQSCVLVTDAQPGNPVLHGIGKVEQALAEKGFTVRRTTNGDSVSNQELAIVAGLSSGGFAAEIAGLQNIKTPVAAESLLIRHVKVNKQQALLVCGADDRGLMYALLDVADRIGWAEDASAPLSEVRDMREKPFVSERALSVYTMHRKNMESYFHDEAYWARYLDLLAESRYNTFVYIFGYSPATHLAPSYPYFFDVDGFPGIKVEGLTVAERQRNLASLKRLIRMAHDRGLNFTLGIWDHLPKGAKGYERPVGIVPENVIPYTKAALTKLLKEVEGIDAIQFRMHWESGLSRDEQELKDFWGGVFRMIKKSGENTRIDARAKGLPDFIINDALAQGIDLRVTTKYWAEQMGLPFHPLHIPRGNQFDRRHGYADLLSYPQKFKMHWKLWNAGTTKCLLWGDPDYARRFAESSHLYGGDGFEVNEIQATKMAYQPEQEPYDLLNKEYRYYDWEFERYWHSFQLFGRLGYNPDTSSDVWKKEFEQRFGKEAALYVGDALHRASRVLPRIIGYAMENFPTLSGYPEWSRSGNLKKYSKTGPSDVQLFMSMQEAAQNLLQGNKSAQVWPQQTAAWFEQTAAAVLENVKRAETVIGANRSKEFDSTLVDLRILAYLARYHATRIPAGIYWAVYDQTGNVAAFDQALEHEREAVVAYGRIVEAVGDVYTDHIWAGHADSFHWRDQFAQLKKELGELELSRPENGKSSELVSLDIQSAADKVPPVLQHTSLRKSPLYQPITIAATVNDPSGVEWVRLRYRGVTQFQDYQTMQMLPTGNPNEYAVTLPVEQVNLVTGYYDSLDPAALNKKAKHEPRWDFMYFFEVMDTQGNGKMYPDFEKETPYVVVDFDR